MSKRTQAKMINDPDKIRASNYRKVQKAKALEAQGGVCAICRNPLSLKDSKWDHDHKTGRFRATLCNHCNIGLGQFKEDPNIMYRAIHYLYLYS